jgi:hypothetical protein
LSPSFRIWFFRIEMTAINLVGEFL